MKKIVHWEFFDLKTGKSIRRGEQDISHKSNRLSGPGINNHSLSQLRKGENLTFESEALGIRAVYRPKI